MTASRRFVVHCNGCHNEDTWNLDSLRHTKSKKLIRNAGYSIDTLGSFLRENKHHCEECNDREKDTFYVYDGHVEEYLGSVEAWGLIHARRVAYEEYGRDRVVKRDRIGVKP